jgi:hypothetical protein
MNIAEHGPSLASLQELVDSVLARIPEAADCLPAPM